MEVKGEGKKCKVVECAMRRCVSVRERVYACEKQQPVASVERGLDFLLKREKKNTKQDSNREKIHLFLPSVLFLSKKIDIFLLEIAIIRNVSFIFALDKTQPSLFPATRWRPYSANPWAFSPCRDANAL